jgi:outer membrane usher protein FimD/PapC
MGQNSNKETLSFQKNLPAGEGIGYRASMEREQNQNQTHLRANPFIQLNGSYGIYTAELQGQFYQQNGNTPADYMVSAAGALLYAGGHIGLSRPVSSSFAVVQVEGVPNVTVLLNNQEVARTSANGMAYIPNLQSYQENKIAFRDDQLPANYLIKRYKAIITPGLFGGECIYFSVAKIQAYGGKLLAQNGRPLEYAKVTLRGSGQVFSFTTLSGGEFYFENFVDSLNESGKRTEACGDPSPYLLTVVPGMYAVSVVVDDSERHFNMLIPISDAMYVPLGEFRLPDPVKH